MPYRVLDHTADFMVEVRARTLSGLFAEAARAMFDVLTDSETIRPTAKLPIALNALDPQQLLVAWLTELLFFHETEQWLFCRFQVRSATYSALEAEVWGEKLDPSRHPIEREIKAVTYHRLGIVEEEGWYRTAIVFDL